MGNCVRRSRDDDDGAINVFGGWPIEVNLKAKGGRVHRCIQIGERLFITLTKEKRLAVIAIPERELRLLRNVKEFYPLPGTRRFHVNDEDLRLEVLVCKNSIAGVNCLGFGCDRFHNLVIPPYLSWENIEDCSVRSFLYTAYA